MQQEKISDEELEILENEYHIFINSLQFVAGIYELNDYAVNSGFFTAPASTKYHLCVPGGLLKHSINVARTAVKINKSFDNICGYESVVLTALFHDLHKCVDGAGQPQYTPNNGYNNEYKPYNWNKDAFVFSGDFKSALIIQRFIKLTLEELQAVAYHSGAFSNSWQDIGGQAYPLTYILHFADLYSSFIFERDFNKENCRRIFEPEAEIKK